MENKKTTAPWNKPFAQRTKPGSPRRVNVSLVFQHEPHGRVYVPGYCPERSAHRVFALDLIMMIHAWN
jgi:hypothetical protein